MPEYDNNTSVPDQSKSDSPLNSDGGPYALWSNSTKRAMRSANEKLIYSNTKCLCSMYIRELKIKWMDSSIEDAT